MKVAPLFLLSALCVSLVLAWTQPASCQTFPAQTGAYPLVSLDVTDVDAVAALDQLFKKAGQTYRIDGMIFSRVSLHIRDASFATVLSALMTAAEPPLIYRMSGDGYHIKTHAPVVGIGDNGYGYYQTFVGTYFIPLRYVSTTYVLTRMRGALTSDLKPFHWRQDPMADQIEYIMVDERRNGFLVTCSNDGFLFFRLLVRNLDEPAPLNTLKATDGKVPTKVRTKRLRKAKRG